MNTGGAPVVSLTWPQVWGSRVRRSGLQPDDTGFALPAAASAACGIHAQMLPAAEISLGIRSRATQTAVRNSLWNTRTLVRTYGIRGTIHIFDSADLALWMAALRARHGPREESRLAAHGLSRRQLSEIVASIGEALDGAQLSLRELGEEIVRRLGAWAGEATAEAFGGRFPRWRIALGAAAVEGVLCFGPNRGAEVTFVRPDQWLGSQKACDPHASLVEAARRFFRTYGPALPRDFAQWFNISETLAADLVRGIYDELVAVDVEGHRCLWCPDCALDIASAPGSVPLLPHFDCYLIGCHPRSRLVPEKHRDRIVFRGGIGQVPVLLVDGVACGVWRPERRRGRTSVSVEPFIDLDEERTRQLQGAAMLIGDIREAPSELDICQVQVRPHL